MEEVVIREPNYLVRAGSLLYLALSVTDRFFLSIPDGVYIPLCLVGLGLIVAGFVRQWKKNNK